jgi:hypothetical protein
MLRIASWHLFTDVSGKHIGPIFKDQGAYEEYLILEDGVDRVSRRVGK